jgi:hypothetical protein
MRGRSPRPVQRVDGTFSNVRLTRAEALTIPDQYDNGRKAQLLDALARRVITKAEFIWAHSSSEEELEEWKRKLCPEGKKRP